MEWIIEYANGDIAREANINFKFVNKENVQLIYFLDKNGDKYGLYADSKIFFINNKIFDFKISKGKFEIVQFKRASAIWNNEIQEKILSWNLGIKNENESYTISISSNREVFLEAVRSFENKNPETRTLRLQ